MGLLSREFQLKCEMRIFETRRKLGRGCAVGVMNVALELKQYFDSRKKTHHPFFSKKYMRALIVVDRKSPNGDIFCVPDFKERLF
jgi:hypothetical protein